MDTYCHWCTKYMLQRIDTYMRQMNNYGHNCCKNCFGKEQSFKDGRKKAMTENNHFRGKHHTEESKKVMAEKAIGRPAWNKGIRKRKKPIIPGSINKWMEFKNQFLKDFGSECLKCGTKNRLEVHHIASKTKFPDTYYNERNCIALCHWCHKDFHKKYTIRSFKPEDTMNWLNEGREKKDYIILC